MLAVNLRFGATFGVLLTIANCGTWAAELPTKSDVYERTRRASAWVIAHKDRKILKTGTGFLVSRARKLLITNYHVVDTATAYQDGIGVLFPFYQDSGAVADPRHYFRFDRPIRGWIVAADPQRDLAVIELDVVPNDAAELPLAPEGIQSGEPIYLVGNPGASPRLWEYNEGTADAASFTKLTDGRSGREIQARLVSVTARQPVRPGCSGGPAVNGKGQLVGVTTMSNATANEFLQGLPILTDLLGCRPAGPTQALPFLYVRPIHKALCVDVTEVKDVLFVLREFPKAAPRVLNPRSAADYRERGNHYRTWGQYQRAIAAYSNAVRLAPNDANAYQALAWLWATCPEAERRDGKKSVEYATKACELTGWKNGTMLDTLAAAYAECGQFNEAARWQEKAMAFAHDEEQRTFRSRLERYQRGQ